MLILLLLDQLKMSIFEQLRRNKSFTEYKEISPKKDNGLFFLLQFDTQGAFIETVDKTGKDATFDYRQYSGVLRSIAKTIHMIRDRSNFTIDWENPESRLYLHEHPYLIPQLLESGIFINSEDEVIKAGTNTAQLKLMLSKTNEKSLSAQLALITPDADYTGFQFINEEHVWLAEGNVVLETLPVGALFHSLENFNLKNLPISDLQKFLSLFFSYLDNVTLS